MQRPKLRNDLSQCDLGFQERGGRGNNEDIVEGRLLHLPGMVNEYINSPTLYSIDEFLSKIAVSQEPSRSVVIIQGLDHCGKCFLREGRNNVI